MFFVALSVCLRVLSAGSSDEATSTDSNIELFEPYAGNLIFSDYQDGSCIACNGTCNETNAVSPHSWTAVLEYDNGYGLDLEWCRAYATDVVEFGVKAFTWNKRSHTCSLHVLDNNHDIQHEMWLHNHFEWNEMYINNTGPLFLVRYPSGVEDVDTVCYYGLNINKYPNISRELNVMIIVSVVIIIISWNVWMNHTNAYPPFFGEGHVSSESSEDRTNEKHDIYSRDPKEE